MKAILTADMAKEIIENETMIKNQEGPYRPQFRKHFDPISRTFISSYESVIKCWPFDKQTSVFIQEKNVLPGMENEVADISMATIDNNKIEYQTLNGGWSSGYMKKYSILIYTPKFDNPSIFLTDNTFPELFKQMKEYKLGYTKDTSNVKPGEEIGELLEEIFKPYMGICTYIMFEGDNIIFSGKWDNQKVW